MNVMKCLRLSLDLGMVEMAKLSGMCCATYFGVESGKGQVSEEQYKKVAKALGVPVSTLHRKISHNKLKKLLMEAIKSDKKNK